MATAAHPTGLEVPVAQDSVSGDLFDETYTPKTPKTPEGFEEACDKEEHMLGVVARKKAQRLEELKPRKVAEIQRLQAAGNLLQEAAKIQTTSASASTAHLDEHVSKQTSKTHPKTHCTCGGSQRNCGKKGSGTSVVVGGGGGSGGGGSGKMGSGKMGSAKAVGGGL